MLHSYFELQKQLLVGTLITDSDGNTHGISEGFEKWFGLVNRVRKNDRKVIFIGNGGSACIASHQSMDYSKSGFVRATAFTDLTLLTCLSNDYGYENVFKKSVEYYADAGDLLVAISSGGRSPNILAAVEEARKKPCYVITFSGFSADNPLRLSGDLNFYTPCDNYTLVENVHLTLSHAFLACHLHPRHKEEGGATVDHTIKGIHFVPESVTAS